jgi:hypothetical protein
MRANGIGYQIDKCSRQLVVLRVVPCRKFERKHALKSLCAAFAWSSVSTWKMRVALRFHHFLCIVKDGRTTIFEDGVQRRTPWTTSTDMAGSLVNLIAAASDSKIAAFLFLLHSTVAFWRRLESFQKHASTDGNANCFNSTAEVTCN